MKTQQKRRRPGEPITENRRVIKIGESYYLNLPPEFVRANRIKAGQKVPITANHLLKVVPHAEVGANHASAESDEKAR